MSTYALVTQSADRTKANRNIALFTPRWKDSGAFVLGPLFPQLLGLGGGVPLPALTPHSSFLPLSFLEREQQGGNCLSIPRTAVGKALWQAPSSPSCGKPGGARSCSLLPALAHPLRDELRPRATCSVQLKVSHGLPSRARRALSAPGGDPEGEGRHV